ncbi:Trans-aconitate 2-methyltransferase [Rhypophila decipiens]
MGAVRPRRVDGYLENGRFYGSWKRGHYPFPYDEASCSYFSTYEEKERLDIFHKMFMTARKDVYYFAPIDKLPSPLILDLGCGTGIWTIDVADKFPQGMVHGVDLALIQPEYIPPNIKFDQMDIEDPWRNMRPGEWDLIHMRTLNGSIANWPHLYGEIYRHLKPQSGYIEQVEIDFVPKSHDNSVHQHTCVAQWAEELMAATEKLGRPLRMDAEVTKRRLHAAGFVEIRHETIMIPLNGWPSDAQARDVGRWFNLGMKLGIHALTVGPLTRAHNRSAEEVYNIINRVTGEIHLRELRGFCTLHIFSARRP